MSIYTVDVAESGRRLDSFVAARTGTSVAAVRRAITAGAVRVDGRSGRKGQPLAAGQRVVVAGEIGPLAPAPEMVALRVLFEDAHVVAVSKPCGVPSHPLRPGETGTLANALVARFPECARAGRDPREGGLVHRLDTATSGVLLAARSPEIWRALRTAISSASCRKTYLAEVAGRPPGPGLVDLPLRRAGRRGQRVKPEMRHGAALPAQTAFEVVDERATTSLVRASLTRGRPHQVRVHLAAAGHPIVGDALYGGPASPDSTLHLHAECVSLVHPVGGHPLVVRAPAPEWALGAAPGC